MTTPDARHAAPSGHPEPEVLMDYWLAALPADEEDAVEQHVMECDACGARLRQVIALADSLRALARSGVLQVIVDESVVARAKALGLHVREYAPLRGASVACTVAADDDVLVARLADSQRFDAFRAEVGEDPRLSQEMKREQQFYGDQSKALSTFIRVLGLTLSVIFSIGATIGAMITMYASVAGRVREIGTLRALGFRRGAVLWAFMAEAMLLGVFGGIAGLALASLMQFASFSTITFPPFADLSFRFVLTPDIAAKTVLFALAMGFAGGFLPAFRAARLSIVDALRAV